MKFKFIKENSSSFSVKKMCQILKVSGSGYYKWFNKEPSKRTMENKKLLFEIRIEHAKNRQVYGSPRITASLQARGIECSRPRVARIMKTNNIISKTQRKFKVTTNSKHSYPVAANLLNQDFHAPAPNKVWASDITYISTKEGWLYLCMVMDLHSRQIVGWHLSKSMSKEIVLISLKRAISKRGSQPGLIFHSDRGSQYASNKVKKLLKDNKFKQSMSGKGNCYDNATVESFFHTLKTEEVYLEDYRTRNYAMKRIFEYIEVFYNRQRIHSSLGNISPVDFENKYLQLKSA